MVNLKSWPPGVSTLLNWFVPTIGHSPGLLGPQSVCSANPLTCVRVCTCARALRTAQVCECPSDQCDQIEEVDAGPARSPVFPGSGRWAPGLLSPSAPPVSPFGLWVTLLGL